MADILKSLLAAYEADIIAKKATTLSYLRGVYIIQSPELFSLDWPANLPCLLIYPQIVTVQAACLPSVYADRKFYQIILTVLIDGSADPELGFLGDAYRTGIATIAQDLETLYRRETFNLSDLAYLIQIDYQPRRIPPIAGGLVLNQVHLTFRHDYLDLRSA